MTRYATFLNPALVDNEGLNKYLSRLFTAGVATSFNSTGWKVVQRGAGANMSVDVSVGDGFLILPTGTYGYWGWTDTAENVAVTAASATNPRIDVVIAKIVTSTTSTSQANSPGALVFQVMAGIPSGTPAAMSDATIQSTIGSGVPWVKLATISVAAASTTVVNANITDVRAGIVGRVPANVPDGSITATALQTSSFPYCMLSRNTGYTINGFTLVTMNTKEVDTHNAYNTANGKFTAPITGNYSVNLRIGAATGASEALMPAIYKNGLSYKWGEQVKQNNGGSGVILSIHVYLNSGDYLELYAWSSSAVAANGTAPECWATIAKVA